MFPESPAPAPVVMSNANTPANAPSPLPPPRTSTPVPKPNGAESSSRAASLHPEPGLTMPAVAPPHGAPTRQYLNSKVTVALLEGMKQVAKEQYVLHLNFRNRKEYNLFGGLSMYEGIADLCRPRDPLRMLGEYLLQRSRETETS